MANDNDGTSASTKKDLEIKKLQIEIQILEKQVDDSRKKLGLPARINNYFQKNLGPIVAVLALLGSFFGPILNYIANQKKSQLISVNNSILQLLDSANTIHKQSKLTEVSLQDPKIVGSFLLTQLNESKIDTGIVSAVYLRMYQVNKDIGEKPIYDRVIFFFVDDNKTVLENLLYKNAKKEFELSIDDKKSPLYAIWPTYIDLIKKLKFDKNQKFIDIFNILRQKCTSQPKLYGFICIYLDS